MLIFDTFCLKRRQGDQKDAEDEMTKRHVQCSPRKSLFPPMPESILLSVIKSARFYHELSWRRKQTVNAHPAGTSAERFSPFFTHDETWKYQVLWGELHRWNWGEKCPILIQLLPQSFFMLSRVEAWQQGDVRNSSWRNKTLIGGKFSLRAISSSYQNLMLDNMEHRFCQSWKHENTPSFKLCQSVQQTDFPWPSHIMSTGRSIESTKEEQVENAGLKGELKILFWKCKLEIAKI